MEKNDDITWEHPGGKLSRMGPSLLADTKLLAIILGSGIRGKMGKKQNEGILLPKMPRMQ